MAMCSAVRLSQEAEEVAGVARGGGHRVEGLPGQDSGRTRHAPCASWVHPFEQGSCFRSARREGAQ